MTKHSIRGPPQGTRGVTEAASPGSWPIASRDGSAPWDQPADLEPAGVRGSEHNPQYARPTLPRAPVSPWTVVRRSPSSSPRSKPWWRRLARLRANLSFRAPERPCGCPEARWLRLGRAAGRGKPSSRGASTWGPWQPPKASRPRRFLVHAAHRAEATANQASQ